MVCSSNRRMFQTDFLMNGKTCGACVIVGEPRTIDLISLLVVNMCCLIHCIRFYLLAVILSFRDVGL